MTVVIEDYSDNKSTESIYISECLRRIGVDSNLWNTLVPFEKVFEEKDPSLVILKAKNTSDEVLRVLRGRNIDVVLNCNGLDREGVTSNLNKYLEAGLRVICLFGENIPMVTVHKTKLVNLSPGVDIFSGKSVKEKDFSFPHCVIINHDSSAPNFTGLNYYHTISLFEHSDITTQIIHLPRVMNCYDTVLIVNGNQGQSQFLLDSVYYAKSKPYTVVDLEGNICNVNINKNTCVDRVHRLFDKMGFSEVCKHLENVR